MSTQTTTSITTSTTVGPRAKCDQVIYEAICKACEIIVGSRSLSSTSTDQNNHSTTPATPRFHLQIPEVVTVRNVLSQYRLQLHVPIRVDVYYQHPSDNDEPKTQSPRRELLERWCLEYKSITTASERLLPTEGYHMVPPPPQQQLLQNDPMTQLTLVCKRLVIWLRTLYCWTRLLPAHQPPLGDTSNHLNDYYNIGCSIYVHTDYTVDDTTDLIQNQGFSFHSSSSNSGISSGSHDPTRNHHPNTNGLVTTTPYGELSWQVVYCPSSKLERLVPHFHNHHRSTQIHNGIIVRSQLAPPSSQRRSQPIPVASHHPPPLQPSSPMGSSNAFAPRSAPSTHYHPSRMTSYTERSQQRMNDAAAAASGGSTITTTAGPPYQPPAPQAQLPYFLPPSNTTTGKSFDPHRHRQMLMHHKSDINDRHHPDRHASLHPQQQPPQQSNPYQQPHHHPPIIHRSQTTIGNSSSPIKIQKPTANSTTDKQPERVMSGLSLALLLASNEDDAVHNSVSNNNHKNNPSIVRSNTDTHDDNATAVKDRMAQLQIDDLKHPGDSSNCSSSYQTRRAALHQMPPHVLQQQQLQQNHLQLQQQPSNGPPNLESTNDEGTIPDRNSNTHNSNNAFGDYGYGYNNHIPWQMIHPAPSNPTVMTPSSQVFGPTHSFGAAPTSLSTSPTTGSTTPMSPIQPHFVSSSISSSHPNTNNTTHNNNNNSSNSYTGRDISPMGGAYFLRSTPPTVGSMGGGVGGLGHFIPPRNRSDSMNSRSVTPPFQPRPIGFITQPAHDPPTTMLLEPSAMNSRLYESSDVPSRNNSSKSSLKKAPSQPPVTSLDSLRSSPFLQSQPTMTLQQHQQNHLTSNPPPLDSRSTMFSSLAAAASVLPPPISSPGGMGGGMESDYLTAPMSLAPSLFLDVNASSSSLRRSLWGQRSPMGGSGVMPSSLAGRHPHNLDEYSNDDYYSEEMPFALELPTPSIFDGSTASSQQHHTKSGATTSKMVGASSTTFGTSSSLATLAQKCSMPNQRLKMFDKQSVVMSSNIEHDRAANSELDDFTNSLADQLQEFRTFGASLHSSSVVLQQQETNAHMNFGGGDERNVLTGSGTSSTSTPISLKS